MEQLLVLSIPGVLVALVTMGGRYVSAKLKAGNEKAISDAEVAMKLRDELRLDVDRLKGELRELREENRECEDDRERMHKELGQLQARVTELEGRVREGRPGGNLGRSGGMGA